MKIELIKYRDAGMATYTYFWKDENQHTVSPFFDSEAEAMAWSKEKPDPRIVEDAKIEDEAFDDLARYQKLANELWFSDGSCTGGKPEKTDQISLQFIVV